MTSSAEADSKSHSQNDDPVVRSLWDAIAAYEATLRQKHGRSQTAGYTRRKIKLRGAIATLSDWALSRRETPAFRAFIESGDVQFTGEYIVAKYPERFETHVVNAARHRLKEYGVELPS